MAKTKLVIRGVVLLAVVVLVIGMIWYSNSARTNKIFEGEVTILMQEDDYYPNQITVRKGTKVTFVNKSDYGTWPASDLHPSHGIYSEFDSRGVVKPGDSWSFTFDKTGEWGMHDHLAPYIVGKIVVVE